MGVLGVSGLFEFKVNLGLDDGLDDWLDDWLDIGLDMICLTGLRMIFPGLSYPRCVYHASFVRRTAICINVSPNTHIMWQNTMTGIHHFFIVMSNTKKTTYGNIFLNKKVPRFIYNSFNYFFKNERIYVCI